MLLFLLVSLLVLNSVTFIMLYFYANQENQTIMEHIEEYELNDLPDSLGVEKFSIYVGCFFIIIFYHAMKNNT